LKGSVESEFRPAVASDLLKIGRLVREFYHKVGGVYGIEYSHDDAMNLISGLIARGICLVGPTSCAGALVMPFPYNNKAQVAYVAFWYFQESREIRIFEELLRRCAAAGATHVSAASHFPHNRIARWYLKLGLHPVEGQFCRALNSACIQPGAA